MILSTTSSLEGKEIKQYAGIVFGDAIVNPDFSKYFSASLSNMFGGRFSEYEEELVKTRSEAIASLTKKAEDLGANALVGVKVEVEMVGESGIIMMVIASGTAVVTD